MPTIRDVAKHANVSTSTVSRVINANVPVSKKSATAVLNAMRELGFHPNALAQAFASNRSNTLGIIVPSISNAYHSLVISGVEERLSETPLQLMVSTGKTSKEAEQKAIDAIISQRCDALILHSEVFSEYEILKLTEQEKPIVVLNRLIPEARHQSIYLDNEEGGYQATHHLLSKGHTEVVCITGLHTAVSTHDRLNGYRRALDEAGIPFDRSLVIEGGSPEGGYLAIQRLLAQEKKFSAVFAMNDWLALSAQKAIKENGMEIPGDISVIGFDNIFPVSFFHTPLTTMHIQMHEIGWAACDLALALINEDSGEAIQKRFVPELIERDSVAQKTS